MTHVFFQNFGNFPKCVTCWSFTFWSATVSSPNFVSTHTTKKFVTQKCSNPRVKTISISILNSGPVSSFYFKSSMTMTNSSVIGIFAISIDAIVFQCTKIKLFAIKSVTFPTVGAIAFVTTRMIDTISPVVTVVVLSSNAFINIMAIIARYSKSTLYKVSLTV